MARETGTPATTIEIDPAYRTVAVYAPLSKASRIPRYTSVSDSVIS